jgi:hypothetical protein
MKYLGKFSSFDKINEEWFPNDAYLFREGYIFEFYDKGRNFESQVMGILQVIKQRVAEVVKNIGPERLFEGVDPVLVRKAAEEVRRVVAHYGSLDRLAAKLIAKERVTNEGVGTILLLSAFGLHYTVKLLRGIKDKDPIIRSILHVPEVSGSGKKFFKATGHLLMHVVAVLYLILYSVGRITWAPMNLRTESGSITQIKTQSSSTHDFYLIDSKGNKYDLVWLGGNRYNVLKDGTKVMDCEDTFNGFVFKGPDGRTRFTQVFIEKNGGRFLLDGKTVDNLKFLDIDLVRDIDRKPTDNQSKDINSFENKTHESYSKLKTTNVRNIRGYDSFGMQANLITESVDMAKKIFRENNMDWVALTRTFPDQWHNLPLPERRFMEVRDELRKTNNLGYLGVFAKVLASKSFTKDSEITLIHTLLMDVMPVMDNLRGPSGEKVSIFDLETPEQMVDSLTRLAEWRKVNQFMRQLPPTQKNIVWPDGWWAPELKDSKAFLNKSITKMAEDEALSRRLLSKISAIRTPRQFLDDVERLSQVQPEKYDQLVAKLRSTSDVIVTWESRQRNAIICMVLTYWAIKKVAPMTNWCIVRSRDKFNEYTRDGLQFVLFDLNQPNTSDRSVIGFTLGKQSVDPLHITECHDMSDMKTKLSEEFLDKDSHENYPRILPEYVTAPNIDLSLTDRTYRKAIEPLRKVLKKPVISKFLDWWA